MQPHDHLLKGKKTKLKSTRYINFRYCNQPAETVAMVRPDEEGATVQYVRWLLAEYRLGASADCSYWISQRACQGWHN